MKTGNISEEKKEKRLLLVEGLKTLYNTNFGHQNLNILYTTKKNGSRRKKNFIGFIIFFYENAIEYKRNSYTDALNLAVGNCFQTKKEAEDITNILTVLNNMKSIIDCIDLKGAKLVKKLSKTMKHWF